MSRILIVEDEEAIADFFNVDLNTLRGRRTYEGELDMAQVEKAMSLYNVYLTVSPDVRSAIDVLLRSAQQVSQATAEIPSVKATKPRAEFPYLKKDTK